MNKPNTTTEKYFNFLNYLYSRKRGFASFQDLIAKFKMCTTIRTVLNRNGIMEKRDGIYRWVGAAPDMDMAKEVLKNVNDSINKCVEAKRNAQTKVSPVIAKKSNGLTVLNIEDLLAQKTELSKKIQKIDMLLEAVENFKS